MSAAEALTLQMLEWIESAPRTREEILQVWRTSCPRLSIWEDACIDGLLEFADGGVVVLSAKGASLLSARPAVPQS
jgi:hypothetical protein